MELPGGLFPWVEIRDAVGQLADGYPVEPGLLPSVRAALAGPCPTADHGVVEFFVDISGCGLFNVDTEELVWPDEPGFEAPEYLPLKALTDPELWKRARREWKGRPREWMAFVWRVAVPLSNRLGFVGAWRQ